MTQTSEETAHAWWAAPRFVLSAAAVIVLVTIGVALFVWPGNAEDPQTPADPQPGTAAPAPAPSAAALKPEDSVCGLKASGGTTLTSAPQDVSWEFVNGLFAPKSADHGPGVIDPETGVRSCYSHTPEGALLAVASMVTAGGDPQFLVDTLKQLAIDGPGKTLNLEAIQKRVDAGTTNTAPIKIEAFRVLEYGDEKATIAVVLSGDTGSEKLYYAASEIVVWQDGDWRFKIADDGTGGPVDAPISDLSGYIIWGPDNG